MHRLQLLCAAALAVIASLAASSLPAQDAKPAAGVEAPAIDKGYTWVANQPASVDLAELRGEVVYIKYWGVT